MKHLTETTLPRLLFVPVRLGAEWSSIRTFRTPGGEATAVAFTSHANLVDVFGEGQDCTRLCERALREAMTDRGVDTLTIDPVMQGTAVGPVSSPGRWDIRRLLEVGRNELLVHTRGPAAALTPGMHDIRSVH